MKEKNLEVYSSASIVKHYASYSEDLQPAEKKTMEILQHDLPGMRMLDIGVGAGRTTPHFAPVVKEYIGIDFSPGMIEACNRKWKKEFSKVRFEICDARDLQKFETASFDLVLFSFNGLDNIPLEKRNEVIREIRRICKPGGYFCFSSHNILAFPKLFQIHFRLDPFKFLRGLAGWIKLRRKYRDVRRNLEKLNEISIYDDVFDLGLFTTYVRPTYQVDILKSSGFDHVTAIGEDGLAVQEEALNNDKSDWIYYLCR